MSSRYIHIRENFFTKLFGKKKKDDNLLPKIETKENTLYKQFEKFITIAEDIQSSGDIFLTLEDFSDINNIKYTFEIEYNRNIFLIEPRNPSDFIKYYKKISLENIDVVNEKYDQIIDSINEWLANYPNAEINELSTRLRIYIPTKTGNDVLNRDIYFNLKEEIQNIEEKIRVDYSNYYSVKVSDYYNYNKEIIFYIY